MPIRTRKRKQIQTKNNETGRSCNGGFTLVEVIISMTILTLVSVPLLHYFSESMRYSFRMAQQQKATIAAQALLENLKAEKPLVENIVRVDGTEEYASAYLESKGYAFKTTDRFAADGTGKIVYAGTENGYDLEVTISAATAVGATPRQAIYGINDSTDVIAMERQQKTEAIAYFWEVNRGGGGTYTAKEQVEDHLNREICVEIGKDGSDYTVEVYYQYTCDGLAGDRKSSDLLDAKTADLENIYILYDWAASGDLVSVKVDSAAKAELMVNPPSLHLVYQKQAADLPGVYKLRVDTGDFGTAMKVHTNVPSGQVYDKTGFTLYTGVEGLTEAGTPARLLTITADVYKEGHTDGEDPLAEIETTKGE